MREHFLSIRMRPKAIRKFRMTPHHRPSPSDRGSSTLARLTYTHNSFENHMISAMTDLLSGLGKLIEKNTKNINKLFKTVGMNNGY